MKMNNLLHNPLVAAKLRQMAPASPYTGKPLTLVRVSPVQLEWENCEEPEWWRGQQDGIYTHQVRIPVGPEHLKAAAIAAGLDADQVELAVGIWLAEIASQQDALTEKRQRFETLKATKRHEAIALLLDRMEDQEAKQPGFGKNKIPRFRAALNGDESKLKPADLSEIESAAYNLAAGEERPF